MSRNHSEYLDEKGMESEGILSHAIRNAGKIKQHGKRGVCRRTKSGISTLRIDPQGTGNTLHGSQGTGLLLKPMPVHRYARDFAKIATNTRAVRHAERQGKHE